jgi:hypothetical protein
MNRWILTIWLLSFAPLHGEEPARNKKDAGKRLAVDIGVLRDGGSSAIRIPGQGEKPACEIVVDRGNQTKTPGEIYLSSNFGDGRNKKPLSYNEANEFLKRIEKTLIEHYGAEKLLEIVLNPVEPRIHLSEEEFGKKMTSDPTFDDTLDARYLIQEIMEYRESHGPETGRK